MTALAFNGQVERVGRGQQCTAFRRDDARGHGGRGVDGEGAVDRAVRAEQTLVEHHLCSAVAFFARLEHEQDPAGELVAPAARRRAAETSIATWAS